jgi:hypothetical protein
MSGTPPHEQYMSKFIVLADDVDHLLAQPASQLLLAVGAEPAQCVLVACAPRMTHRVSKWVSHSSREHWRDKWAAKLFAQLVPRLEDAGHRVLPELARGPIQDHIDALLREGPAQVLDLRRPKRDDRDPSHAGWSSAVVALFGSWLAIAVE